MKFYVIQPWYSTDVADADRCYEETIKLLDGIDESVSLLRKYDCAAHCYVMSGNDLKLDKFHKIAPDIKRCTGGGSAPWQIVERAIKYGTDKVQLFKPYFKVYVP